MNTKTILAIIVVLIFVASCANNVSNNEEKPVDNTNPGKSDTTPKEDIKTDTQVINTKVNVTSQPEKTYPVTLTAEKVGSIVKLTWTPYSEKFTAYKIVRSTTDPNPKYPGADLLETIASANQTSYIDDSPMSAVNYYSVGVLSNTNKGDMSNVVLVDFPDSREKQGNTITLTAVKTSEGVNLTWNAYDDADGKIMYYKVVRSDTNPTPKYPNDIGIAAIPYVDKTDYLDRTIKSDKIYYYSITVVRKDFTRYTSEPVIVTT